MVGPSISAAQSTSLFNFKSGLLIHYSLPFIPAISMMTYPGHYFYHSDVSSFPLDAAYLSHTIKLDETTRSQFPSRVNVLANNAALPHFSNTEGYAVYPRAQNGQFFQQNYQDQVHYPYVRPLCQYCRTLYLLIFFRLKDLESLWTSETSSPSLPVLRLEPFRQLLIVSRLSYNVLLFLITRSMINRFLTTCKGFTGLAKTRMASNCRRSLSALKVKKDSLSVTHWVDDTMDLMGEMNLSSQLGALCHLGWK